MTNQRGTDGKKHCHVATLICLTIDLCMYAYRCGPHLACLKLCRHLQCYYYNKKYLEQNVGLEHLRLRDWKTTGKSSLGSNWKVTGKSSLGTPSSLGSHWKVTGKASLGSHWKITGTSLETRHWEATGKSLEIVNGKQLESHWEITGKSSLGSHWKVTARVISCRC